MTSCRYPATDQLSKIANATLKINEQTPCWHSEPPVVSKGRRERLFEEKQAAPESRAAPTDWVVHAATCTGLPPLFEQRQRVCCAVYLLRTCVCIACCVLQDCDTADLCGAPFSRNVLLLYVHKKKEDSLLCMPFVRWQWYHQQGDPLHVLPWV